MSRPGSDGPENVDATFEEIVADLRAEGFGEQALADKGFADDERHRDGRYRDGTADGGSDDSSADDGADRADRGRGGVGFDDDPGVGNAGGVDELRRPEDDRPETTARDAQPNEPGWRDNPIAWDETMFGPAPGDPNDPEDRFVPPEPPPLPTPRKGAFLILMLFVLGVLLLITPSLLGMAAGIATPLGMLSLAAGLALLLLRVRQGPPPGADPNNGAQV
ncbi:hypothetical protein BJF85_03600 [Saccharomonospora sp. CUA-673]|uniref:hypothetical protein n=1 Tax=Saccharomonospora sp. CUA-673 TaxID=1904969 RepID=UPI00095E25BE|nr:hypothetical protein [Saccharomonospora sp. CUA-673]OLT43146.1 hypothetical protein BJF85_03600 [Saccharomonospora sp. CUA-673]